MPAFTQPFPLPNSGQDTDGHVVGQGESSEDEDMNSIDESSEYDLSEDLEGSEASLDIEHPLPNEIAQQPLPNGITQNPLPNGIGAHNAVQRHVTGQPIPVVALTAMNGGETLPEMPTPTHMSHTIPVIGGTLFTINARIDGRSRWNRVIVEDGPGEVPTRDWLMSQMEERLQRRSRRKNREKLLRSLAHSVQHNYFERHDSLVGMIQKRGAGGPYYTGVIDLSQAFAPGKSHINDILCSVDPDD